MYARRYTWLSELVKLSMNKCKYNFYLSINHASSALVETFDTGLTNPENGTPISQKQARDKISSKFVLKKICLNQLL